MNKGQKDSAFPRLFFIPENMTFGEMKKKIYLYARNYIYSPFDIKYDQNTDLDREKHNYRAAKKEDNFDTTKLFNLYNKEYLDIFSLCNNNDVQPKSETGNENDNKNILVDKFMNNFPYKIVVKRKFTNQNGDVIVTLFDGKNVTENLSQFEIYTDEDKINKLLEKIISENLHLFIVFNPESKYVIQNIRLDSCENFEGPNFKKADILSLDNLLEYFCSDEYLDECNQWVCSKCKNKVKVDKKFSIYFVPRILIICLNRFERHGGNYQKNSELVDFPLENLDMGKYICGPDKEHSKYDLFAVSQHYGGTGGGHYTAVCKNNGKWFSYNDSSCHETSENDALTSAAYVLFYRRQTD
jgi:hypothetical protein